MCVDNVEKCPKDVSCFLRQIIKFSNDVYGYIGMPLRCVYVSLYAFLIIKRRRYDLEKPFNDVSFNSIFPTENHM